MPNKAVTSIFTKTLAAFLLAAVIPTAISSLMLNRLLTTRLDRIETDRLREAVARTRAAMTYVQDDQATTLTDYAHWNDLFERLRAKDAEWIGTEVVGWSLQQFDMDLSFAADRSGRVVVARTTGLAAPADVSSEPYFQRALAGEDVVGWIATEGGPMIVAASAVTPTEYDPASYDFSAAPGVLFFGRLVNDRILASISGLVGVRVEAYADGRRVASSEAGVERPDVETLASVARAIRGQSEEIVSEDSSVAYDPIYALDGDRIAALGVTRARMADVVIRDEVRSIIWWESILAATLALGLSAFMSLRLTRPILSLTRRARAFSAGGHVETERSTRTDEIGELENAFVDMVGSLERRELQLKESNRKAEEAVEEAERVNRFLVGRELRMAELKRQNEELKGGKDEGKA